MAGVWIARRKRVKDGVSVFTSDWLAETSPTKLRAALAATESMHGTVQAEKHVFKIKGKALLLAALSRDLKALSSGVAERVTYNVDASGARALRGSHEKHFATRARKDMKTKKKKGKKNGEAMVEKKTDAKVKK